MRFVTFGGVGGRRLARPRWLGINGRSRLLDLPLFEHRDALLELVDAVAKPCLLCITSKYITLLYIDVVYSIMHQFDALAPSIGFRPIQSVGFGL
ncbi:hypothetical protein ACFQL0_22080 [Haloplanus litoreus]|uniref:hypothetical protein n=1 Tax=Haloplanus litoreus TaxID=767515 RepID=UPI0036171571